MNMRISHCKVVAAVAAMLATGAASQALAQSAQAEVGGRVVSREIAVFKETDMNLGTIVRPASGIYTVNLASGGSRSGSGGVGGALVGGAGQTATFTVTGDGNRVFTISTPGSVTLVRGAGGAGNEVVFTPTHAATENTGGQTGEIASKVIEITGSLAVPATVSTGAYSSSLPVTVGYQ